MRALGSAFSTWCRIVLIGCFFVIMRIVYAIHVDKGPHLSRTSHTYFAIMHKRDSDPPTILPSVVMQSGWHAFIGQVHFGMRSDAFSPGFLARMVGRPRWFARLLRPINVGPLLHSWGVHPLLGLQMRPAEDWIRTAVQELGDISVGEALAPAFIHAIALRSKEPAATLAKKPLSDLLQWSYFPFLQRYIGTALFAESQRRTMERLAVSTVKQQLGALSTWLQQGGSMLGAPEGMLSPDGKMSRISGGFQRILRDAPADTQVVPIAITYDFMTRRRIRAFIATGSPIPQAPTIPTKERDASLHAAWRQNAYFTCTQLGSEVLTQYSQAAKPFTNEEFAATIFAMATTLAQHNRKVDPELLVPAFCDWRVEHFLAYAAHTGAIERLENNQWHAVAQTATISATPGEVGYLQQPFAYAWNEFHDMLNGDEALTDLSVALLHAGCDEFPRTL